ncbi:hypothetical protein M0R45_013231 [Rubus argutus]|uniref:BHLH domain-containing protein n=1 Tax=Rubus argutus TaxID=59490 RepID=A0AAW1XJF8_RUBAR
MDQQNLSGSSRIDRKTAEKIRREQMKALFAKLKSTLQPHQSSREVASLPDQLDKAVNYIRKLQINLEKMREKKDSLMRVAKITNNNDNAGFVGGKTVGGLKSPQITVCEIGSALEVVLITGLDCQFTFAESIRVLHEEGADIVNASFSVVEDTIFHTIHSKITSLHQEL